MAKDRSFLRQHHTARLLRNVPQQRLKCLPTYVLCAPHCLVSYSLRDLRASLFTHTPKLHSRRAIAVLQASTPVPNFIPDVEYRMNSYLLFKINNAFIYTVATWIYYFILEPGAAVRMS